MTEEKFNSSKKNLQNWKKGSGLSLLYCSAGLISQLICFSLKKPAIQISTSGFSTSRTLKKPIKLWQYQGRKHQPVSSINCVFVIILFLKLFLSTSFQLHKWPIQTIYTPCTYISRQPLPACLTILSAVEESFQLQEHPVKFRH